MVRIPKSFFFYYFYSFAGQLNRPSVTTAPSDDLLALNNDEFITENDGTLVNNFFLFLSMNFVLLRNVFHQ
jgi:hypothetical protein